MEQSFGFNARSETINQAATVSFFSILKWVYFAVIAILGFRLLLFIVKLLILIKKGVLSRIGNSFFVATSQQVQPFSFFNFLFFNAENNVHKETTFIQPIRDKDLTRMASGWGYRIHPIYKVKKFHYGQDYAAPLGTPILATAGGRITKVVDKGVEFKGGGYGNYVEITHDEGFTSRYAQMSKTNVKAGDEIKQGAVIGEIGNSGASTAPHLHFELHKEGNAINPASYFKVDC